MYFFLEGKIGIGYNLIDKGKNFKVAKYFKGEFIACDHYVLNSKRCEFLYMILSQKLKGFALSKKFIFKTIYPKFPELIN